MTRDEAVALIERMKTIRPTCEKCEMIAYPPLEGPPLPKELAAQGWEEMAHRAGYVKRCKACASGCKFPWADKLTPEAVIAFIEREPWRDEVAWLLDELKPVADAMPAPGGFEFL